VKSDDGWERNEILLQDTEMNRAKAFGDPYMHYWTGFVVRGSSTREKVACGLFKLEESRTVYEAKVTCPKCREEIEK
jgi:hypothetical protein